MGHQRKTGRNLPQRLGPEIGEVIAQYSTLLSKMLSARTFGEAIDRYRVEVLSLNRSAHTRRDQTRQLAALKKVFGDLACDSITAQHCYQYYDARRGLDGEPIPITARREVSLLRHVFSKAILWGVVSSNPARDLVLCPKPVQRDKVQTTKVAARKEDCNDSPRLAIDLAVTLGQRPQNLLKMTPRVSKNRTGRR